MRVGLGYDVHALDKERDLVLGGVKIPHEMGLVGHSDADVLIHAIMDAILGAMTLGDIGRHFPDTSEDFKNIDSRILLRYVTELMEKHDYMIGNIDAVICAQRPKISPHIEKMRLNLASDLKTELENISVKATTTERLGFEGREEGISVQAIVMLFKKIRR